MFHHNTFVISQEDLKRHCCGISNLQLKHLEDDSFCASKTPNRKKAAQYFSFSWRSMEIAEQFIYLTPPSHSSSAPSHPAHPRYFNQLSTGLDMVGLAADWLTSTANTNM